MYHNKRNRKLPKYYCSVYNIEKWVEQELLKYTWTYPR